ncbi:MAG: YaiO family outer membrane beta-barrel protein [Cyclobacteriaceae bacterium]|nr:YaiO family outer membrane beta-barrel protein [Cyclobacteriaceae bacterium]MCH8515747.1 YaiO family outer membrane beta-barrel protein [Cyclobacteriaceae bacterium]
MKQFFFTFIFLLFFSTFSLAQDYLSIRSAVIDRNYKLAKEDIAKILKDDPRDVKALNILARVYLWEQKYDSAHHILDRVESIDELNETYFKNRFYAHLWQYDFEKARETANAWLESGGDRQKALILIAESNFKQGEFADVLEVSDTLLLRYPHRKEGYIYRELGARGRYKNKLRFGYYLDYLPSLDQPWQRSGASYSRTLGRKTEVSLAFHQFERFDIKDQEFKLEINPYINRKIELATQFAYSVENELLPSFRWGAELIYKFDNSFHISAGWRQLFFDDFDLFVFTMSFDSYFYDWHFNLRPFVIPFQVEVTPTAVAELKKFIGKPEKAFSFLLGYGYNPDDYGYFGLTFAPENVNSAPSPFNELIIRFGIAYEFPLWKMSRIRLNVEINYEELDETQYRFRHHAGASFFQRF